MLIDAPDPAQQAAERAYELERTYGKQAIAAAKAGLQASSAPADIEFWASVCAILATSGHSFM